MFFTKLTINNETEIEKEDDGGSVCVVGSLRSTISDTVEDNTESVENTEGIFEMDEEQRNCFNKWKEQTFNKNNETETETRDSCDQTIIDEKLNEDDEDENRADRIYVISIDNIPYYYEYELRAARAKMWSVATEIMKEADNDDFTFNPRCIFANSCQNKLSVVSQYSFLGLNYNHTISELEINYVIKQ
jgi:hypothetical protein